MSQPDWQAKVALYRKRFGCRTDTFGVKHYKDVQKIDGETGKKTIEKKGIYSPQCDNFGNQSLCLISQGKGGCSTCTNKKPAPLTDEWVWKHISGKNELIFYLLQVDKIKFGACDFDRGDPFGDAKMIRNFSVEKLGLPCYVARSSKKGYHVYWFFSDLVQAHHFTSMVRYIYTKTGIYERSNFGARTPIPEVFPKQTYATGTSIGNGIKTPMIEPKFAEGFNCWVDSEAKPYIDQWTYLLNCEEVTPEQLEKALVDNGIEILQQPAGSTRPHKQKMVTVNGVQVPVREGKIEKRGDFNEVVKGCPALRQFWEKDTDGSYKFEKTANENGVPHHARFASLAIALSTTNGLDMIRSRWPSPATESYITQAEGAAYSPTTCRYLQENGICRIGQHPVHNDHCFKKKPPRQKEGDRYVTNPDNLPESEWPEPSPYRLATTRVVLQPEEIEQQLYELQKLDEKPDDYDEQFLDLLRASKRLPTRDADKIEKLVKRERWLDPKELKTKLQEADRDIKREYAQQRRDGAERSFQWNEITFYVKNGRYVRQTFDAKGFPHDKDLTNFVIDINEEIYTFANADTEEEIGKQQATESVRFIGTITVDGQAKPFVVQGDSWQRGTESFFGELIKAAGSSLLYERADCDHIRMCTNYFSNISKVIRRRVKDIGCMTINKQLCYMMPSVMITADAIVPNTELEISFQDDASKDLDFKILTDEEFKDLALHVVDEYFNCNLSIAAMTAFAHAMSAAMYKQAPIDKSPLLFIHGNQSSGKSFVAEAAQCFFGDFRSFKTIRSSGKGMQQLAMQFRHALLLCDDFKQALADFGGKSVLEFIQSVYDRSGRVLLKRSGEIRDQTVRSRGLVLITAQDVPEKEDSAISRMIMVNVPDGKAMDNANGERVRLRRQDYCGFTPYFIQYVFNTDRTRIKELFDKYAKDFEKVNKEEHPEQVDGVQRIANNLAFNMTAFHLAMEMLHTKGVLSEYRRESLCAQHVKNLEIIRTEIYRYVSSQKGVSVFLDTIKDLLQDPARYHIINWPGVNYVEHKNSHPLGFYKDGQPDVVYVYAGASYSAARKEIQQRGGILHPQTTIGKQLEGEGHLEAGFQDRSDVARTKYVTAPAGNRVRCWVMKLSALGYDPKKPPTGPAKQTESPQLTGMVG